MAGIIVDGDGLHEDRWRAKGVEGMRASMVYPAQRREGENEGKKRRQRLG